MKKLIIFMGALLLCSYTYAQNTIWVEHGKAPKTERGNDIANDNFGNLYITGDFQDSVRFDHIKLTDGFGTYCAKYDTAGNIIWAYKNMGGSGVTYDGNSNLYLYNNENLSIQKIDLNGTVVWNSNIFSSSNFGSCGIQDVYAKGNDIYVTGYYSGDAYFSSDTLYNSVGGGWEIFIAKFNSAGQFQWATSAGGIGLDKGYGLYVNNADEVYAVGYFKDSAHFQSTTIVSNGLQDMYLAKYSSTGNLLWVNHYGDTGFDLAAKIIADDAGNLYVTGRFKDLITFGSTSLIASNTDAFITKFDPNGNVIWAKGISGAGNDEEADMDYENGKISFLATTVGAVSIDALNLPALGSLDMCIGHLDTSGTIVWAKIYGGTAEDEGSGIVLLNGSTYFNGSFKNTANYDSYSLTSLGQWDIVTGKIDNQLFNGVELVFAENQISIYPNPASNSFIIEFDDYQNNTQIKIMDIMGREYQTMNLSGTQIRIEKNNMASGVYFVQITNQQKRVITKKIVLQ